MVKWRRVGRSTDGAPNGRSPLFGHTNRFLQKEFIMNIRRLALSIALPTLLALASANTLAQDSHVRGEVILVDATQVVVKTAEGATTTVRLDDKLQVLDVSRTSLQAVADKSYIGVAAAPAADGKVRALGVMVFPEGARGLNEGSFPWDIQKSSSMTNATVSRLLKKDGGAEIEVKYGQKTKTILVDKDTVFGQFVPGAKSLIVKGSKVVLFVAPTEGGPATAGVVMVGRDGFQPPV
jgi:hypothetical protein